MKAAIVVFPGSNRERDAEAALTQAMGRKPIMVWHRDTELPDVDLVLVPGGFSYGDYLRAGAIARFSPAMRAVARAAREGRYVLGICNGFQILTEAGLLPGALRRNESLQFRCEMAELSVENTGTPFTSGYRPGEAVRIPVAHGEGNYFVDDGALRRMEERGQIVFRYARGHNPNGSVADIAGVVNEAGNVLGMMPHPERAAHERLGSADGARLFASIAAAWRGRYAAQ